MDTVEKRCPKCHSMMQSVDTLGNIPGSAVIDSIQTTASGNISVNKKARAFVCDVCGYTEISDFSEPFHS